MRLGQNVIELSVKKIPPPKLVEGFIIILSLIVSVIFTFVSKKYQLRG